jgi:hypothetical protein
MHTSCHHDKSSQYYQLTVAVYITSGQQIIYSLGRPTATPWLEVAIQHGQLGMPTAATQRVQFLVFGCSTLKTMCMWDLPVTMGLPYVPWTVSST